MVLPSLNLPMAPNILRIKTKPSVPAYKALQFLTLSFSNISVILSLDHNAQVSLAFFFFLFLEYRKFILAPELLPYLFPLSKMFFSEIFVWLPSYYLSLSLNVSSSLRTL